MSQDQTQDAFANVFQFVKGEQPTATKFTGWVQLTDAAFSTITEIIGDPHDYTSHTCAAGSLLLSPARLGQPTIARVIGPSDYISPQGGSVAEPITATITVSLESGRNSWSLGFPLVNVKSGSTVDTSTTLSDFEELEWGTDINLSVAVALHFITEKTSLEDLATNGDFYIDYWAGIIYHYNATTSDIELEIDNIHMFSAGVPWGTHNVIPTWEQTTKCNITKIADVGDETQYRITLPTISRQPRLGAAAVYGATSDVLYKNLSCSGDSSYYRLPYSLTSVMTGGDSIPDGFMYLWDDSNSRVVPQCRFVYSATDAEHQVLVYTPTDWLTETDTRYRLLVCGTSLAEAVNYLSCIVRDNTHVGMYAGGSASTTIAYTNPISHDSLADRWAITSNASLSDISRYYFTASNYPTNCHPQYLHRGGYMTDDEDGNSANAMRGWIVFAGSDSSYSLSDTYTAHTATYGIKFGWNTETASGAFRLSFEGGQAVSTWSSGAADRLGYGIVATEAQYPSIVSYGALALAPFLNAPLHLRGYNRTTPLDCDGSVLGFDFAHQNEMNYVKLWPAVKDYTTYGQLNLPANISQGASWGTALDLTPDLSNRLSPDQMREFRFRSVPYCSGASNTGLGSTGTEFAKYFTSPSMIGADFVNVYSNAIFFSEGGDGAKTSFHLYGEAWMNGASIKPTGIYYLPVDGSNRARLEFWLYDNTYGYPYRALKLGRENTGTYATDLSTRGRIRIRATSDTIEIDANSNITNTANIFSASAASLGAGAITLTATASTNNEAIRLNAPYGGVDITAGKEISLTATEHINLTSSDNIYLTADNNVNIVPGSGNACNIYEDIYMHDVQAGAGSELRVDGTGQVWKAASSIRYKTNITQLNDVSWLYDLHPVSFEFKNHRGISHLGLIAEEVFEINKDLVLFNREGQCESVYYDSVFSAMLKALQDQKKEIEQLKAQLKI